MDELNQTNGEGRSEAVGETVPGLMRKRAPGELLSVQEIADEFIASQAVVRDAMNTRLLPFSVAGGRRMATAEAVAFFKANHPINRTHYRSVTLDEAIEEAEHKTPEKTVAGLRVGLSLSLSELSGLQPGIAGLAGRDGKPERQVSGSSRDYFGMRVETDKFLPIHDVVIVFHEDEEPRNAQ